MSSERPREFKSIDGKADWHCPPPPTPLPRDVAVTPGTGHGPQELQKGMAPKLPHLLHVAVLKGGGELRPGEVKTPAQAAHGPESPSLTPPWGPCHLGVTSATERAMCRCCLAGTVDPASYPATANEKCFMHFNQRFILDSCPLKGFPQGQEFKNWTNKYKGNKHQRQAGGQAKGEPCPGHNVQTPKQPESSQCWSGGGSGAIRPACRGPPPPPHSHSYPRGVNAWLFRPPPPATLLCDLGQGLPSLV